MAIGKEQQELLVDFLINWAETNDCTIVTSNDEDKDIDFINISFINNYIQFGSLLDDDVTDVDFEENKIKD